jgi:hypothetical protein
MTAFGGQDLVSESGFLVRNLPSPSSSSANLIDRNGTMTLDQEIEDIRAVAAIVVKSWIRTAGYAMRPLPESEN